MNNNNEEQEKITKHKSIFTKGVKDKTIGLFSDSFLNKMKAFDYLGIPFITFATSGIFKYKYFTNIIMIEAYLLSDYGKTSIVKNNNSHCLILLEKANGQKYIYDSLNSIVFTYDTFIALEDEVLEEIISQDKIIEYFGSNDNINYIDLESTKRKVLVEASIRNYKLQLGKLEMDILDYLSSYMTETSSDKIIVKRGKKVKE